MYILITNKLMFISENVCAIDYIARLALDCPMGLVSYAASPAAFQVSILYQYLLLLVDVCQVVSQESPIFSCNDNGILVR